MDKKITGTIREIGKVRTVNAYLDECAHDQCMNYENAIIVTFATHDEMRDAVVGKQCALECEVMAYIK